jgi:hypothetical protein
MPGQRTLSPMTRPPARGRDNASNAVASIYRDLDNLKAQLAMEH